MGHCCCRGCGNGEKDANLGCLQNGKLIHTSWSAAHLAPQSRCSKRHTLPSWAYDKCFFIIIFFFFHTTCAMMTMTLTQTSDAVFPNHCYQLNQWLPRALKDWDPTQSNGEPQQEWPVKHTKNNAQFECKASVSLTCVPRCACNNKNENTKKHKHKQNVEKSHLGVCGSGKTGRTMPQRDLSQRQQLVRPSQQHHRRRT